MHNFTFEQLVDRYGEFTALSFLDEIEKAAKLQPQRMVDDFEARLAYACQMQDVQALYAH